jgi:hypothetical protein
METTLHNDGRNWKDILDAFKGTISKQEKNVIEPQSASRIDSEKIDAFWSNFKTLRANVVTPAVNKINQELVNTPVKLKLIDAVETPSRPVILVLLSIEGKEVNLMRDPYLLIEGNPFRSNVRIAEGRSENEGKDYKITHLTEPEMTDRVVHWLQQVITKNS